MSLENTTLRPRLALVLASSLCAAATAGAPQNLPLPEGPLIAQASPAAAPAEPAKADQPPFRADGKPVPEAPKEEAKPAAEAKPADQAKPADVEKPADQAAQPPAESTPGDLMGSNTPSDNVTINLIRRLVKKGLLEKAEADEMIQQAKSEAAVARTNAQMDAEGAAQAVVREAVESKKIPDPGPAPDDAVRVTYIPEFVKKQIRDELRADIAAQAKSEGYVNNTKVPEWVTKFRVKGDVRLRYEGNYFPSGNDNTGAFPNFNSINSGAPFDVAGTTFSPQLNVDNDRQRYRLRLRLGAEVDMGDGFTAGLRLASGESSSPTSPNQSFGGSGGQFSKYAIWIDRVFLKYEAVGEKSHFTALGGRFDNPFFSTDTIFDEDLGFDGFAVNLKSKWGKATPFVTIGAFPIFNTDFNFSSNQPSKFDSTDKYLYGAQIGSSLKITDKLEMKLAAAYYHFDGVRGEQSTPYTPLTASDAGDTDGTRPSFAQKGNTYIPLRRIIPNANNNFGTTNQFQYFGLGTEFQPLVITGRLDYNGFEPFQVSIIGEYIRNLGFDRERMDLLGINNRAPQSALGTPGRYAGGDTAWMLGVRGGAPAMEKRGDWQAGLQYKHIESDAVVDGFTDSDFGLGGTNMKGFTLWGAMALTPKATFGVKWVSTSQIAGPPSKNDTLQLDFTGKF